MFRMLLIVVSTLLANAASAADLRPQVCYKLMNLPQNGIALNRKKVGSICINNPRHEKRDSHLVEVVRDGKQYEYFDVTYESNYLIEVSINKQTPVEFPATIQRVFYGGERLSDPQDFYNESKMIYVFPVNPAATRFIFAVSSKDLNDPLSTIEFEDFVPQNEIGKITPANSKGDVGIVSIFGKKYLFGTNPRH